MKQSEAAKKLGVNKVHLNAIVKGRSKPSLKLAIEIEKLLGVRVEEMIPEIKDFLRMRNLL